MYYQPTYIYLNHSLIKLINVHMMIRIYNKIQTLDLNDFEIGW